MAKVNMKCMDCGKPFTTEVSNGEFEIFEETFREGGCQEMLGICPTCEER